MAPRPGDPSQGLPPVLGGLVRHGQGVHHQEGVEHRVIDSLHDIPEGEKAQHRRRSPATAPAGEKAADQSGQKARGNCQQQGKKGALVQKHAEAVDFHHALHIEDGQREQQQKVQRGPGLLPFPGGEEGTHHGKTSEMRMGNLSKMVAQVF